MAITGNKFFLVHKVEGKELYARNFPPLEQNVILKVILGSVLERCLVEEREEDLELFMSYLLVLRTRFQDKKYFDMEVIQTEAFKG